MKRNVFFAACIASAFAVSCGSDSKSGTSVPTVSSFGSCNYAEQGWCTDYASIEAAASMKESCAADAGGSYSATSSCKTGGKVKGCEFSAQAKKIYTQWAYSEESATALDSLCALATSSGAGNTSAKVVMP